MATDRITKAYSIVKDYEGQNNLIRYFKSKYKKGDLLLDDFAIDYIMKNKDYVPFEVNRVIGITKAFAEKIKEKYFIDFLPTKIKIGKVIGEINDCYHCYVQYRQSVEPQLMYVSKRSLLSPLNVVDSSSIEVDFDKYDKKTHGRKIKEHQKEAVKFMLANKKCILAHGMGLGKTNSSIVASMETGVEHILVITTASLKSNWQKEIELYESPDNITIINGSKWGDIKKFTIINYDIVQNFYEIATDPLYENVEVKDQDGNVVEVMKVPVMVKSKSTGEMVQKTVKSRNKDKINEALMKSPLFTNHFDCVIIDEAHKLSNNTSIRYKTIADFLQKSKPSYVFLATGTPLTNRPINLYHILKLINAEITNDYFYYVKQFCGGKEMRLRDGRTIMKMGDATNLDELREKIKHVYVRRTADEIGDMVKKEIITKRYDLNDKQKAHYDKLWKEYQEAQEQMGNNDSEEYRQLVEGMLVRQFLAKEMTSNTIDLVDELIESGEKVVIMTTFQEEMDILVKHYGKKCVYYNGKMTTKAKDKAQDEFMNNPKVMVFIGNVAASGVGISLPIARFLAFNSYDWSSAVNKQAEDRIYRITQTRDIQCIYQLFTDSVSEDMFDKVIYKEMIANETIKSEKDK